MENVKGLINEVMGEKSTTYDAKLSLVKNGMSSIQVLDLHTKLKDHYPDMTLRLRSMPKMTLSEIELQLAK